MADNPQVPSIAPVQTAPSGPGEDLSAVLGQMAQQVSAPLPPQFVQGTTIAQPRINPVHQYQQQNDQRAPISPHTTSLKQARTQNAFASLANVVGRAGQAIQQKKQDNLKEDLKNVMAAKENVANAESVLQQDPNNAMAKQVLAANKKQLDAILSDPKKQKQLAKALDISFTDMDKNKTPEVKAYQDAMKEHKEAGAYKADNPAEAKIAAQAAGPQGGQQQQQPQQQQQSATPRADAALSKDLPNMQVNPQYSIALKQQEDAKKQLNQYVIPRLITAEAQKQVQAMRDGNANARAEFKAVTDFNRSAMEIQGRMDVSQNNAKARMAETIRRDTDAMARTKLEVDARLKIAADKRLDPGTQMKLKTEALDKVDQSLKAITAERKSLSDQLAVAKTDDEKQVLGQLLEYNTLKAQATNTYRQKVATDVYGRVEEGSSGRFDGGISTTTESVGSNLSDESDDEDSDSY